MKRALRFQMRWFPLFALIGFWATVAQASDAGTDSESAALSPEPANMKISFRLGNGLIVNQGAGGREAYMVGGFNLGVARSLDPSFEVTFEYSVDFDYGEATVPLDAFTLGGRYYLLGIGMPRRDRFPELVTERRSRYALYVGGEVARENFYTGYQPGPYQTNPTSGTCLALHGTVGINYELSRRFELNVEGNFGLLSFASSDDRVRLNSMLLKMGVSFLW